MHLWIKLRTDSRGKRADCRYDRNTGLLLEEILPDGVKKEYTYDTQRRTTGVTEKGMRVTYAYDSQENLTEIRHKRVHNAQALLVDGHHRLEAFNQLGYDRVPIK